MISDLEKVRQIITAPKNLVLHIAANLEDLPNHLKPDTPVDVLSGLLPSDVKSAVQKYVCALHPLTQVPQFSLFSFFFS